MRCFKAISLFSALLFALSLSISETVFADECSGGPNGHLCTRSTGAQTQTTVVPEEGMACVARGSNPCYEQIPIPQPRPDREGYRKSLAEEEEESGSGGAQEKAAAETGGDSAQEQLAAQVEACESAAEVTTADCSSSKSDSTTQQAMSDINAASAGMNGQKSAGACRKFNSAIASANNAMSAMKQTCQAAFNECRRQCGNVNTGSLGSNSTLNQRFRSATAACTRGSSLIAGIDQNIVKVQSAQNSNTTCQADATNGNDGMGSTLAGLAGAAMQMMMSDCSNATYAASNPQACGGTIAPPAPVSVASVAPAYTGTSSSPYSGGGENTDFATGVGGGGNLGGGFGSADSANFDDPYARNASKGGGGGGLPPPASGDGMSGKGGGGANKPGAPQRPGRPPSTLSTNILGGARGGGPGSAFAAAVAKDPGSGSVTNGGSWIPPKVPPGSDINLDKFRPEFKGYRLPTGTSGSTSELLGSHVDIWKQVNLRYLSVMVTLQP